MNSKIIFRTEVDTSLSINNLSHSDRFILIGSCFSNQMSKYFNTNCFDVLNPFGNIYNPISLQQNYKMQLLIKYLTKLALFKVTTFS